MECGKIKENLSALIDNELTAPEKSAIDEHLGACPDCSAVLEALRDVLVLVSGLDVVKAPKGFMASVYKRMDAAKAASDAAVRSERVPGRSAFSPALAAAACFILVLLAVFFLAVPDTGGLLAPVKFGQAGQGGSDMDQKKEVEEGYHAESDPSGDMLRGRRGTFANDDEMEKLPKNSAYKTSKKFGNRNDKTTGPKDNDAEIKGPLDRADEKNGVKTADNLFEHDPGVVTPHAPARGLRDSRSITGGGTCPPPGMPSERPGITKQDALDKRREAGKMRPTTPGAERAELPSPRPDRDKRKHISTKEIADLFKCLEARTKDISKAGVLKKTRRVVIQTKAKPVSALSEIKLLAVRSKGVIEESGPVLEGATEGQFCRSHLKGLDSAMACFIKLSVKQIDLDKLVEELQNHESVKVIMLGRAAGEKAERESLDESPPDKPKPAGEPPGPDGMEDESSKKEAGGSVQLIILILPKTAHDPTPEKKE